MLNGTSKLHDPANSQNPPDVTFGKLLLTIQMSYAWAESHIHHDPGIRVQAFQRNPSFAHDNEEPDDSFPHPNEDEGEIKAHTDIRLAEVSEDEGYNGKTGECHGRQLDHEISLQGKADAAFGMRMGAEDRLYCW